MTIPLEKIRAACIVANPEIVELKFGCEMLVYGDVRTRYVGQFTSDRQIYYDIIPNVNGNNSVYGKEAIILGRPIRLADVLLMLGERVTGDYIFDHSSFCFFEGDDQIDLWEWYLKDDDLSHQSEETLQFIASLL